MNTHSTTCPACQTPRLFDEQICAACGLIFASFDEKDALPPAPTVATFHGPPLPSPLPAGAVLAQGRYSVGARLDLAGAARYHARDHALFDRPVALEALPCDEAARPAALGYAQAVAQQRHPALPHTLACFQEGGTLFIVSEPVAGAPLSACHRPSIDEALRWGALLYDALACLHAQPSSARGRANLAPEAILYDAGSERLRLAQLAPAGVAHAPADDVAVLASTLYQLATGDDAVAGGFAQLGALGPLGAALERALDPRPAARPPADALAQQLRALQSSGQRKPLAAPDGSALIDVPQLVAWCEANWQMAATWLAGQLPELIALRWGDEALSARLRALVAQHADPHERLDAALALLDPQGFGSALPTVVAQPQLRFGTIQGQRARTRPLLIANAGRRYVRCVLHTSFPGAVRLPATFGLPPGERRQVPVGVALARGDARLRTPLAIQHNGQTIANVELRARLGRWSRNPVGMSCLTLVLLLVLVCNTQGLVTASGRAWREAQFSMALMQGDTAQIEATFAQLDRYGQRSKANEGRREEHYFQAGLAALGRSDEAAARAAFLSLYELDPTYKTVDIRLRDLLERDATRLINDGLWDDAARAVVGMEAVFPGYAPPSLPSPPELQQAVERARAASWRSGRMLREAAETPAVAHSALHGGDGSLRVGFAPTGRIAIFTASDGALVSELAGSADWGSHGAIRFSPDSSMIAVVAGDGVHVARVADGAALGVFGSMFINSYWPNQPTRVGLTWSSDGQFLVATAPRYLAVWRLRDQSLVVSRQMSLYLSTEPQVTFSPDNSGLAIDRGSHIFVWRTADGALLQRLDGVSAVGFSPDGQRMAAGDEQAIRVWRVSDGAPVATVPFPGASGIALSADGSLLAAVGARGVELWDIGDARRIWSGPASNNGRVQFDPDGRSLVVIGPQIERWRPLP